MKNIALLFILLAMVYAEFSIGKELIIPPPLKTDLIAAYGAEIPDSLKTASCVDFANGILQAYGHGVINGESNFAPSGKNSSNFRTQYELINGFPIFSSIETTKLVDQRKQRRISIQGVQLSAKKSDHNYLITVYDEAGFAPLSARTGANWRMYEFFAKNGKCELKRIHLEKVSGITIEPENVITLDFDSCFVLSKGLAKDSDKFDKSEFSSAVQKYGEECKKLLPPPLDQSDLSSTTKNLNSYYLNKINSGTMERPGKR